MKNFTLIFSSLLLIISAESCKKLGQGPGHNLPPIFYDSLKHDLLLYYPFNGNLEDGSGNTLTGTGHDLTLTTDRNGKANSAYYFNGSSSYITVSDITALNLNNIDFTLTAWIKLDSYWPLAAGNSDILCKRVPGVPDSGWGMSVGSDNIFSGPGGGSTNAIGYTAIDTGKWYMTTAIYKNSTKQLSLYVNNTLISTTNNILTPTNAYTTLLYIGCDNQVPGNSGYFFHGSIDEVRIYTRVLSLKDMTRLYNFKN